MARHELNLELPERPRRINILGNTGSSKSTLARIVGERLQIPVVHLDRLFWEPGWQEADTGVFRQRVAGAVSGDAWVCEGNYAATTFDLRVPQADVNIWLETPRLVCAVRVLLRSAGLTRRPDRPAGCAEGMIANTMGLVRDVWRFDAIQRGRVESELGRWSKAGTILRFSGRNQIGTFVNRL